MAALLAIACLSGCSQQKNANTEGRKENTREEQSHIPVASEAALPSVPGFDSAHFSGQMASVIAKTQDYGREWKSESAADAISAQLQRLAELLESRSFSAISLTDVAVTDVISRELRPAVRNTVFSDGLVTVDRATEFDENQSQGLETLTSHLDALIHPLQPSPKPEVTFKIYRIDIQQNEIRTITKYSANGPTANGTLEQSATMLLSWTPDELPKLKSISASAFEEITPMSQGGIHFVEKTASAFIGAQNVYSEEILPGTDYWRARLQGDFNIDVSGLTGLALGDANGDGLEDLYFCQQGGLPNRLFLRNPDGTLRDHSKQAGVDWMELTRAALFVDFDNDGDQDLALTQGIYYVIMENVGDTRFEKRIEEKSLSHLYALAATDYDNDGDVDLYVCGRNPSRDTHGGQGFLGTPIPFHDANNGGPNILLNNAGNWKFKDVTLESGMDRDNRRYSYAAAWEDFDNDGDQDLYVANDFGRNCLYSNDNGKFSNIANVAGVEDISSGMGATWADIDNNGAMDLYVSNMFSSAGNRIAYQRHFRQDSADSLAEFRRHARGNSLFTNNGDGTFADVSVEAGVSLGRWAWGSQFADLNNDGWRDLVVANGFITAEGTGDL